MRRNLFAYTATGINYPEYVSVNREDNGTVSITVRNKAKEDGSCGDTASVELEASEVSDLFHALQGDILSV
jgi:hypothetical protein